MAIPGIRLLAGKAREFDRIADILFPVNDPGVSWGPDTLNQVSECLRRIYPEIGEGDRTPARKP